MKSALNRWFPISVILLSLGIAGPSFSLEESGDPWKTLKRPGASDLEYALLLPPDFSPEKAYPCLLALPPGSQDRAAVEAGLNLYWASEAAKRGWVVASPAAPDGVLFFEGSETSIPALLDQVSSQVQVETGRFHIAGPSNGGRSAFRIAGAFPESFASIVVLPGFPSSEDQESLNALKDLPIVLYVGAADRSWRLNTSTALAKLQSLGASQTSATILEGEGHILRSLTGTMLFDRLERIHRNTLRATEIGTVLDDFHLAASEPDSNRYFSHFTPDAVFLGTDASERWNVSQFKQYAHPHFSQGRGWTYIAKERHISLSGAGDTGWFDERLHNEKYGEVRGSGVVVKGNDGIWRISQYNLAFPVPNELASELVEKVKSLEQE